MEWDGVACVCCSGLAAEDAPRSTGTRKGAANAAVASLAPKAAKQQLRSKQKASDASGMVEGEADSAGQGGLEHWWLTNGEEDGGLKSEVLVVYKGFVPQTGGLRC